MHENNSEISNFFLFKVIITNVFKDYLWIKCFIEFSILYIQNNDWNKLFILFSISYTSFKKHLYIF